MLAPSRTLLLLTWLQTTPGSSAPPGFSHSSSSKGRGGKYNVKKNKEKLRAWTKELFNERRSKQRPHRSKRRKFFCASPHRVIFSHGLGSRAPAAVLGGHTYFCEKSPFPLPTLYCCGTHSEEQLFGGIGSGSCHCPLPKGIWGTMGAAPMLLSLQEHSTLGRVSSVPVRPSKRGESWVLTPQPRGISHPTLPPAQPQKQGEEGDAWGCVHPPKPGTLSSACLEVATHCWEVLNEGLVLLRSPPQLLLYTVITL